MGQLAGHTYVTRTEWGARAPLGVTRIAMPSGKVYIHHTAGHERGAAGMRSIQNGHMRPVTQGGRGFRDIAYSFVIDGDDGVIYEGRGVGVKGGHVTGTENNHHGICLMGNFEHETLTDSARSALVHLLRYGHLHGWWRTVIVGHRDAPGAQTACPGDHLYARLPDLRRAITATIPAEPPTTPPAPEEPTMYVLDCFGKPALVVGLAGVQALNKAKRDALVGLGVKVRRNDDHANWEALWALRTLPVDVDEAAIAAALVPVVTAAVLEALPDGVPGDLTVEDLADAAEAAVRRVFADAAD